jgi:hypothetical protein
LNFQRALNGKGNYLFNRNQTWDASGGIVSLDISGKSIRARLVDNSGNVTGNAVLTTF